MPVPVSIFNHYLLRCIIIHIIAIFDFLDHGTLGLHFANVFWYRIVAHIVHLP